MARAKRAAAAASPALPVEVTALYTHEPHPHTPRNANERHAEEQAAKVAQPGWRGRMAAFNERLATHITLVVSTMWCAYAFVVLALSGFPGLHATGTQYVQWFSQTFLQLVFLPIIAVGTAVLNRHAEIQADEAFKATLRTLHESEQMRQHLDAQDAELLRQGALLATIAAQVAALSAPPSSPTMPMTPSTPMISPPPSASPLLASAVAPRKRPRSLASTPTSTSPTA